MSSGRIIPPTNTTCSRSSASRFTTVAISGGNLHDSRSSNSRIASCRSLARSPRSASSNASHSYNTGSRVAASATERYSSPTPSPRTVPGGSTAGRESVGAAGDPAGTGGGGPGGPDVRGRCSSTGFWRHMVTSPRDRLPTMVPAGQCTRLRTAQIGCDRYGRRIVARVKSTTADEGCEFPRRRHVQPPDDELRYFHRPAPHGRVRRTSERALVLLGRMRGSPR